jgi:hypothetical protein
VRGLVNAHSLWLQDRSKGCVANFSGVDLEEVNFEGLNLDGANFAGVNLYGANLKGASMRETNFMGANLRFADLSGSSFVEATLEGASLDRANCQNTNFFKANLKCANLVFTSLKSAVFGLANLTSAYLGGADCHNAAFGNAILVGAKLMNTSFKGASLKGADLTKAILPRFQIVPSERQFVGWKKVEGGYILKLLVSGERTSTLVGRKCRCSKAKVLAAYKNDGTPTSKKVFYSCHDLDFRYEVGKWAKVSDYNGDIRIECTNGIHFFMERSEAENY